MINLKSLREEKSVTQQKVAEVIGSTQQSIQQYEIGLHEPDIHTMMLLANYFDTSIDYLVGATDIKRRIESVEKYELTPSEQDVIDQYRGLAPKYKKFAAEMLSALIDAAGDGS